MDTAERTAAAPMGAAPAWKLRVEESIERAILRLSGVVLGF